jgi:hypothetical protein
MKSESKPASIPFSITPDAEDYLRNQLNGMPPHVHPVLMMTTDQTDGLNPPQWHYEGQSFIIAYSDTNEKPEVESTELELLGRPVAIELSALKQLSGRTLSLRRVAPSLGLMGTKRYVLVADSVPDLPGSYHETSVSPEQKKRLFSIATLTILGGFAGMGVTWIGSCIIFSMFKLPLDRFLPLSLPVFVIGWIAGAIISFIFFRSVFKTDGRTKFRQEQTQRKYLGYGGLEAQLDWWVFLGIPVPLTGILVLSIEPFAHTVGGKTAFAIGPMMVILGASLYFCDRIPRRLVFRFGILGWLLTFALGFWYFKTHGP